MQVKCRCGWKKKMSGKMCGWPGIIKCKKCGRALITRRVDDQKHTTIVEVLSGARLELPQSDRIPVYT